MTFPEEFAKVVDAQELTFAVPEIAQLSVPDGAAEPAAPVTVAVKVSEPPRVADPEATTEIVGAVSYTHLTLPTNREV